MHVSGVVGPHLRDDYGSTAKVGSQEDERHEFPTHVPTRPRRSLRTISLSHTLVVVEGANLPDPLLG